MITQNLQLLQFYVMLPNGKTVFSALQGDDGSAGWDFNAGAGVISTAREISYYNSLIEREWHLRHKQGQQHSWNYGSLGNFSSYHSQVETTPDNQLLHSFRGITLDDGKDAFSKQHQSWKQPRYWMILKPSVLVLNGYSSSSGKMGKNYQGNFAVVKADILQKSLLLALVHFVHVFCLPALPQSCNVHLIFHARVIWVRVNIG